MCSLPLCITRFLFSFFFYFSILFAVDRLIPDTGCSHKRRIYCFSGESGITVKRMELRTEIKRKEKGREKIERQK